MIVNTSTSSIETYVSGDHVYGCNFAANQYFSKSFQVFFTNSIPVEMTSWSLRYVSMWPFQVPVNFIRQGPLGKGAFCLYYNVAKSFWLVSPKSTCTIVENVFESYASEIREFEKNKAEYVRKRRTVCTWPNKWLWRHDFRDLSYFS